MEVEVRCFFCKEQRLIKLNCESWGGGYWADDVLEGVCPECRSKGLRFKTEEVTEVPVYET